MASTYTPLGVEKMATGENAGTWGTKTNTNLEIIEQFAGGYTTQSIAGGVQTTTLSVSDGSTGAVLAHRVIEFTGSITGNQTITIPLDVQTNKTLTSPKIGTSILDTNGNELFLLTATGSAVNELTYANAATGNNPSFTASGETNVGINLVPKGSGTLQYNGSEISTVGKAIAMSMIF